MKQPGLDGRHRDKSGEISQKHGNTKNGNLPKPIEGFSQTTTLSQMRQVTGKISEADIRKAVRKMKQAT